MTCNRSTNKNVTFVLHASFVCLFLTSLQLTFSHEMSLDIHPAQLLSSPTKLFTVQTPLCLKELIVPYDPARTLRPQTAGFLVTPVEVDPEPSAESVMR